jgi:hypothetical protein
LTRCSTEYPRDRVGNVTFAAAVRAYDGGYAVSGEEYLGVVREGFETGNLEAFQFEHAEKSR